MDYQHLTLEETQTHQDGTGMVYKFFSTDLLLLALLKIDPGCSLNRDIHKAGEEGYYVLEGELTVELPERHVTEHIKAGEVFYIPADTYHIASNTGKEPLRFLAAIGGDV